MALISGIRSRRDRGNIPPDQRLRKRLYSWKVFQCVILILNLAAVAFLTGYISSHKLGLAGALPVCIIMAGVSLLITMICNWFGRYINGYGHRVCISFVLLFDIVCIGTQVAAIVVLSVAGLPYKCSGVTSNHYGPSDTENNPAPGFSTVRFGDDHGKGELDRFCSIPRLSWVISLFLLVSYVHTFGLSIRLIHALGKLRKQAKRGALEDQERGFEPSQARNSVDPLRSPPAFHVDVPVSHQDTYRVSTQYTLSDTVPEQAPAMSPPPYTNEGGISTKQLWIKKNTS